jgi:hypothetical protein
VHAYFSLDWAVVREVATVNLPDMAPKVLALLRTEDPEIAAKFGTDDGAEDAEPGSEAGTDFMVTESMGPIYSRTQEQLGSTDRAITRMRQHPALEYVQDDGCLRREPRAACAAERFETPVQPRPDTRCEDTAGMPG